MVIPPLCSSLIATDESGVNLVRANKPAIVRPAADPEAAEDGMMSVAVSIGAGTTLGGSINPIDAERRRPFAMCSLLCLCQLSRCYAASK